MKLNINFYLIALSVVLISGCASNKHEQESDEYNQRVSNIITSVLQGSNDEVTSAHLRCFKCETNKWPNTISELKIFSPESKKCKTVFKTTSFSDVSHIQNAAVSVKEGKDKIMFLFSEPGKNFDNINMKDNFVTKNFNAGILNCAHNN